MDDWLTHARDALAAEAPLLFYLVGRAQGSSSLDDLAEAVRRSTS